MNWKQPSQEMTDLFNSSLPEDPLVQHRKMFGFPAAFVNGNLFASMHQTQMVVRLPKEQYDELLAIPGAAPFEPMPGRAMSGYAVVPDSILEEPDKLREWLERGFKHAMALPAKERKPAKRRR